MNKKLASIFWGVILIGFGLYELARAMGYFAELSISIWIAVFTVVSLFAFVLYAASGWKEWGWLFPFGVFGGLGVTLAAVNAGVENAMVASSLFLGLLIPFAAAYLTDRSRNWWALIPGGVMLFLAFTTLLVDNIGGEWIGFMFLFMVAIGFLLAYLNDRARKWALLVAYILFALSVAPAMASFGGETAAYYGPVFLVAVALPFFYVYFQAEQNWWAIIPAGILTTLAVISAFAIGGWIRSWENGWYANAAFMGGFAATFAVVWFRHAMPWAKIVAIVLAALAVASLFFSSYANIFLPLVVILAGIYILYSALKSRG